MSFLPPAVPSMNLIKLNTVSRYILLSPHTATMRLLSRAMAVAAIASSLSHSAAASNKDKQPKKEPEPRLRVEVTVAPDLLPRPADGRLVLMFAPEGVDPLADIDVATTPNQFYGIDMHQLSNRSRIVLSGGSREVGASRIWGHPRASLDDMPPARYRVQAFFTAYENVTRGDGSYVSVHFPCGEGSASFNGAGSLSSKTADVVVTGRRQHVEVRLGKIKRAVKFDGDEIGGCAQGNYKDTKFLKYVKIRSKALSLFWGRSMYVGANVLLPPGYNASDRATRYPVVYSQGPWPGPKGAFGYPAAPFSKEWEAGKIPGERAKNVKPREAPRMIMVTFRHETPFFNTSYAVNSANMGPWGDAINNELVPHIDKLFNTIAEPWARVQEGAAPGGWSAVASVVYRSDLYGGCFASFPHPLSFTKFKAFSLYTEGNAFTYESGQKIGATRRFFRGHERVRTTIEQETSWELVFGTLGRSGGQWDGWNAVYGVQGIGGMPLEPWNKTSGDIYREGAQLWKPMDLRLYLYDESEEALGTKVGCRSGAVRVHVWADRWDDEWRNKHLEVMTGYWPWANFTTVRDKRDGDHYLGLGTWDYLELIHRWMHDHRPNGNTPLLPVGERFLVGHANNFTRVLEVGGAGAAQARQRRPTLNHKDEFISAGKTVTGRFGLWDPGVALEARWIVNGKPEPWAQHVRHDGELKYKTRKGHTFELALEVAGSKYGLETERRRSNNLKVEQ